VEIIFYKRSEVDDHLAARGAILTRNASGGEGHLRALLSITDPGIVEHGISARHLRLQAVRRIFASLRGIQYLSLVKEKPACFWL
jgi:hypothetical protein